MSCEISVVHLNCPLFVGTAPQGSAAAPPAISLNTMPYCVCILYALVICPFFLYCRVRRRHLLERTISTDHMPSWFNMILHMRSTIHTWWLLWPSGRTTALHVMYYRKSAMLASILNKRHQSDLHCQWWWDNLCKLMPWAKKNVMACKWG